MLLFFRFFGLMLVLSVVCVVCGGERVKPVTVPTREATTALSHLFVQLPECVNPNPAIPVTMPKRVFYR